MQSKMQDRQYQSDAEQSVIDYYTQGNTGNPIVVAATGAGKSIIIGKLIKRIMTGYAGQRILMITHVKELIAQNYEKLITFWPDAPAGIYSAGIGKKQPWCDIVCGGIQSMHGKAARFGHRNIIIIDECHLLSPEDEGMYMAFINALKEINPNIKVIGFTATEWRTKGGSLVGIKNGIFTDVVYKIGIKQLVDMGYLAPLVSKSSLIQADLTGVKKSASELTKRFFTIEQAAVYIGRTEATARKLLKDIDVMVLGKPDDLWQKVYYERGAALEILENYRNVKNANSAKNRKALQIKGRRNKKTKSQRKARD